MPGFYIPGGTDVPSSLEIENAMLTNFAWGVVDLSDDTFTAVAPEVGAFKAIGRKRGEDSVNPTQTDLVSHACTQVELGLVAPPEEGDAKFYKPV